MRGSLEALEIKDNIDKEFQSMFCLQPWSETPVLENAHMDGGAKPYD